MSAKSRGLFACLCCTTIVASAEPAFADTTEECINAHVAGQRLRKEGKIVEARDTLQTCSRDVCPKVLVKDCAPLLREVEQLVPSVVIEAHGESGADLVDVRVIVDDKKVADHLEGKTLEIDPGPHRFRYESAGRVTVDQTVVIREGERARRLVVRLEPPRPFVRADAAKPAGSRPVPALVYGLGGLAVAGLSVFAVMGSVGRSQKGHLDSTNCAPNCSPSDVDATRRSFLIADVGLGVGSASLIAAGVVFLTRPTVPARSQGSLGAGAIVGSRGLLLDPQSGFAVDVTPTLGGGGVVVARGAF